MHHVRTGRTLLAAAFAVAGLAATVVADPPEPLIRDYVSAVVGPPPASLGLDRFYRKHADALGIPVVGSANVPDAALLVARDVVIHMLARRPDVRGALVASHWRIAVMAQAESTTDIPEHRAMKKPPREELTAQERAHYERVGGLSSATTRDSMSSSGASTPTTAYPWTLIAAGDPQHQPHGRSERARVTVRRRCSFSASSGEPRPSTRSGARPQAFRWVFRRSIASSISASLL